MLTEPEDNNQNQEDTASNSESTLALRKIAALKPKHPMETLLKKGGVSLPKSGEVIQGTVLEKKGAELYLDLGMLGTGIVFGREFRAANEIIKKLEPGTTVSGKVVELDNEKGYIELSLKEAGADQSWAELKRLAESGEILEIPVFEANRGGLLLELKGVKGFLPASQLSQTNYPRVEGGDKEKIFQELQKLVGKPLKVKILDLNPIEQKLIFTEKGQTSEELGKTLEKYKVGDTVEGEITGVVDFGAFMKFDETGLEGLIHISEIDWTLIENPREVLKAGERKQAKIIDIQGDKVSLSLKQLKEDPWAKVAEKYQKGDVIKGKVTKFNPYGVFIALDSQIQGLVHISEFGTELKMKEELELGKDYEFKVLLCDPKEHRMSLGMIRPETKEEKTEKKEETNQNTA